MMPAIKMNKDVTSMVLATTAIAALILPPSYAFFSLTLRTTMRVTGVESTPNPCSFKFDLDHSSLAHKGSKGITYTSRNSADAPGEIKDLIELEGVDSVYALGDWLCLNKKPSANWNTIVPAAVEALGGPAESLDPALLMLSASGEDGGSLSKKRSGMDGIDVRLQVSNGIPIQVEACPPGGTPIRRKLSPRFIDAMNEFVKSSGDEMAFFKGRQWLPRGVRYPDDDDRAAAVLVEEALSAAVDEVELAYNESRLRGVVAEAMSAIQRVPGGGAGSDTTREADAAKANSDKKMKKVQEAVAALRLSSNEEVVAAVDRLCDLAEDAIPLPATSGVERESSTTPRDALDALVGFVSSGAGPVAARRSAVSFVGGVGEAAGVAGLEAVASVFRGDKSPGVRRTAGDALSDLGNPGAVPVAVAGLRDTSKLVRWRAARVIGELGIREEDAVSLDEVREVEVEFEVAFEMSDAARKVRTRISAAGEMGEQEAGKGAAAAGPVWKQIQERR